MKFNVFSKTPLVHLKHDVDGYPLCWDLEQDGKYEATSDESKVTCQACRQIFEPWDQ